MPITHDALEALRRNLTMVVRRSVVPRTHERIIRRAGLEIDRVEAIALSRVVDAGAMRVTELSRGLGVACSTGGRHAAHLEAEGLAARGPDPEDGRVTIVTPTDAGRRLVARLRAAHRAVLAEELAGWDEADIDVLADLLGRLAEDLEPSRGSAEVPA